MLKYLTIDRYTASCGERRIRVHTAAASVVPDLGEMYRQADTGAIVSLLGRLGKRTLSLSLSPIKKERKVLEVAISTYLFMNGSIWVMLYL